MSYMYAGSTIAYCKHLIFHRAKHVMCTKQVKMTPSFLPYNSFSYNKIWTKCRQTDHTTAICNTINKGHRCWSIFALKFIQLRSIKEKMSCIRGLNIALNIINKEATNIDLQVKLCAMRCHKRQTFVNILYQWINWVLKFLRKKKKTLGHPAKTIK